jgi:multicomponent Na+:H+ antiporter subunit D
MQIDVNWFEYLPWVIMLPLVTAIFCFMVKHVWVLRTVSLFSAIVLVIYTCAIAYAVTMLETRQFTYELGGWAAPLGIGLVLTPLSAVLIAMTAIVALAISFYASGYFSYQQIERRFWSLWWLLLTSLFGIFMASDIFNIYVMLELMGLSAVGLISLQKGIETLKAAYQYLLVGLFGSLLYLLGVALLYREYAVLDINLLTDMMTNSALSQFALLFITLGLLLKTALFPLHFWLPAAHSSAPAPVSAALSGIVVKATYFLLFQFWFVIMAPVITYSATVFMGLLGMLAVIWGSWQAFRSRRLKLLVAYSTVAQLGYLFILFPLYFSSPELAKPAMLYFVIAHAFAKSAMFMAVGSIQKIAGFDDIHKLSGISAALPVSTFTFAIASASLIGLPPSGGFIAKWLILSSAISADLWAWIVVILVGGLLSAAYLFKVLNQFFTTSNRQFVVNSVRGADFRTYAALALALLTIALGLNALWLFDALNPDVILRKGI